MVLTQRVNTPFFGEAQMCSEQISTAGIRKAVMDGHKMRVLPHSEWMKFSWAEIRTLLHETATYVVPTEELIDYLDNLSAMKRRLRFALATDISEAILT